MADVTVVGAGPVGLTAALALRARGVDVTVLEAGAEGRERPGSRAIFLHRETLAHWERISPGLGRAVAAAGISWRDKRTFWGDRQVFARTYPPAPPAGLPHSTNLPQVRTEAVLLDAAVAAGARIAWSAEVEKAEVSPAGVRLGLRDGTSRSAPYVIAADGARSTVRASLGIELEGDRSEEAFVIVDLAEDLADPLPLERRYHYRHPAVGGRNVLLVPFAGGWRADLQCRPDDDPERFNDHDGVRRWISRVMPPAYADRVSWVSTYRFAQVLAESFVDPDGRVMLVGEAAHLFAPFGARGLNSGVVDAVAAADAVATTLADVAGAGLDGPGRPDGPGNTPIGRFAETRRAAAERNRHAAGLALAHMRARGPVTRARRRAAAELARFVERPGAWLDSAPYGPRQPARRDRGSGVSGRSGDEGRY